MTLTVSQRAQRENKITASFLPALMAGDDEAIRSKYLELIGDPAWRPEDVSRNWPIQFGSFIEGFALDWHQAKILEPLIRRGEVVDHPTRPYFCCTLDAWRQSDHAVIDCKSVGAWRRLDEALPDLTAQLVGQQGCTGAAATKLLVVHGGGEPQEIDIQIDPGYAAEVWRRVDLFQRYVETLTPPVIAELDPVVPPEHWRTLNFNNEADRAGCNFAKEMIEALDTWALTKAAAGQHDDAKETIKVLLPADVGKVLWSRTVVQRSRSGSVTTKFMKSRR